MILMALNWLFFSKNRPAIVALLPDPSPYEMIDLYHFAQLITQSRYFSNKKILASKPLHLAKSWSNACLWVCRRVEM